MGFLKNPGIRRQNVFLAPFSENCSERQVCFLAQLILPGEISPIQTFTPHLLSWAWGPHLQGCLSSTLLSRLLDQSGQVKEPALWFVIEVASILSGYIFAFLSGFRNNTLTLGLIIMDELWTTRPGAVGGNFTSQCKRTWLWTHLIHTHTHTHTLSHTHGDLCLYFVLCFALRKNVFLSKQFLKLEAG